MPVIETTYDNFEEVATSGPVVIDFWATWCPPCKLMSPLLEELSNEMSDVKFLTIDVDDQEGLTKKFDVGAMPTFLVLNDGEIVGRYLGACPKEELKEKIELALQ